MPSALKRIIHFLGSYASRRGDRIALSTAPLPLDLEQIKRRLQLEERGQADASRELPPAEAAALSATEQEVVSRIEEELKLWRHYFMAESDVYQDRLNRLNFGTKVLAVQNRVDRTVADMQTELIDGENRLFTKKRALTGIGSEYRYFVDANRLHRLAEPIPSRWLTWGLVGFMLAVETGMNAFFFAQGSDLGLIGGAFVAAITATLNIGFALMAGLLSRYVHHVSLARRIIAWTGLSIYIAFAVGLNLFVSRYRDIAANLAIEDPESAVITSFLAAPFEVSTLNSALLLLVGLGLAAIAFYKGYRFDDPYPGFGRLSRRRQQAEEDYADEKRGILDEVKAVAEGIDERLEAASRDLEGMAKEYASAVAAYRRRRDDYLSQISYLEQCANDLLATYRQANRTARQTPPPRHFDVPWRASDAYRSVHPIDALGDRELSAQLKRATQAVAKLRDVIKRQRDEALSRFRRIEELTEQGGSVHVQAAAFNPR